MKFMKLGCRPGDFHSDGNDVRFLSTELASDVIIIVDDVKFHLHKFPLLSKCGRLQNLIVLADEDAGGEIRLPDFPGGAAAFEICAKFCYAMTITLGAQNSVAALCAAAYLDMNESVEKGNLIRKVEIFISSCLLCGWKDSIVVLQTTYSLHPWPEDLNLTGRCVDSIASKICTDISRVEWSYAYDWKKLPEEDGGDRRSQAAAPSDWWAEDICDLDMELFKKVITAVKARRTVPSPAIGEALRSYTYRRVAGFAEGVIQSSDVTKNRLLVEEIVRLLAAETGSVSCRFLLRLLRAASVLGCAEERRKELVKMAGRQLAGAGVIDLLIPAGEGEKTLFDVDLAQRILEESLKHLRSSSELAMAARLLDGFLAEIAVDRNISLSKFIELAELLPAEARPLHDGLYRAVDSFLKARPETSKGEKMMTCRAVDFGKLSVEARMHAVQNERLPLRVVVRVLFFNLAAPPPPAENGGSFGSSASADWDLNSTRSTGPAAGGRSESSSGGGSEVHVGGGEGHVGGGGDLAKMILRKMWSMRGGQFGRSTSGSDSSESADSADVAEREVNESPSGGAPAAPLKI